MADVKGANNPDATSVKTNDASGVKLDVRVYPINEPKSTTMAFASVSIADLVAIRGMRIVDSQKGLFVSMPQSQDPKTKEFHDTAFPIAKGLRQEISKAVLDEYALQKGEKPLERKPGLDEKLKSGAAKAAVQPPLAAGSRGHDAVAV